MRFFELELEATHKMQNVRTGVAGGELCLTDAGRLGVICSCHGLHMSVTKFTHVSSLS